jgi:hypothetical protein
MTGSAWVGRWMVLLPTAALGSLLGALAVVDVRSWCRTDRLRHGIASAAPPSSQAAVHARTSRLTLLPGWAGVAGACTGLAAGVGRNTLLWYFTALLLAGGAIVALTGFRSRVRSLGLSEEGLVVGYAHRRAAVVPWSLCRTLVPPRWPGGGWRVAPGPMLMPSDLWGQEAVLEELIARVGLAFDGRRWVSRTTSISRER